MDENIDVKKKSAQEGRGSLNGIEQLKECEKQKEEYLAGWQRSRADFLNYKKEDMERVSELLKYWAEEIILKVLPILDNFDASERNLSNKDDKDIMGLLQIKSQFQDFLKSQGVEEIKSLGEKFDPNIHEVVGEIAETGSLQTQESGIITEEVQKGYKINSRLLRPAKVKVTK